MLGCVNFHDGVNAVLQGNHPSSESEPSEGVKAAYGLQICVTDDKFFTLMGDSRRRCVATKFPPPPAVAPVGVVVT